MFWEVTRWGHWEKHPEAEPINSCIFCHAKRQRPNTTQGCHVLVPEPGDVASPPTRDLAAGIS